MSTHSFETPLRHASNLCGPFNLCSLLFAMSLGPPEGATTRYRRLIRPPPPVGKQLQRRMPLRPHRYSRKRDSRRAHFRGLGVTHSAQLAKVCTKGEVRGLGTDRSRKNNFLTVDVRRWCGGKRSGRERPHEPEAHQGQGAGEGRGPRRIKYKNMC